MCLHDVNDIADYLLEVEASMTRKISRQQRIEEMQELTSLLQYLVAADRDLLPNSPIHRVLETLIRRTLVFHECLRRLMDLEKDKPETENESQDHFLVP